MLFYQELAVGVLCVSFGIYEKLLDSVLNFSKDVKNNLKFLFPILIGAGIGVVLFGNLLKFLFNSFEIQTKFCFIGIILGGIPSLLETANSKGSFKLHHLVYTLISLLLTLLLLYIENKFSTGNLMVNTTFLYLMLARICNGYWCSSSWS